MTATPLDFDRFTKVRKLMLDGATPGERYAAKTRAEAMARSAGLSFAKACVRADTAKTRPAQPTSGSPAASFAAAMAAVFDTPVAKAERAEREVKRQARCRELLAEYGSEDAVFADTPREAALRGATAHLRTKQGGLTGWGDLETGRTMPTAVREAVTAAWPMPTTVAGAWAEYRAADRLADHRAAFDPSFDTWDHVRARGYLLEQQLDTLPAGDFGDVLARIAWLQQVNDQGWQRDVHDDARVLATLQADIERLAVQSGQRHSSLEPGRQGVQSGQGTAATRRSAVIVMLTDPRTAALTDREIARRAGVPPTTVGTLRRLRCVGVVSTTPTLSRRAGGARP